MTRSLSRLYFLMLCVFFFLIASAMVYKISMFYLEGQDRSFLQSLAWAAETLTTTGYGSDSRWNHPFLVIFVILVQFLGVFLVFLIVPIYLIPMLEERFEVKLPVNVGKLKDHVVIWHYGPVVASLVSELKEAGINTAIVEPDLEVARSVHKRKWLVINGDLEEDALKRINLLEARAIIANSSDEMNASVALAAREMGYTGDILVMLKDSRHRKPVMLAGADSCYTPKHILGAALAVRASTRLSPRIAGLQSVGRVLQMGEIRIAADSPLAGKTLGDVQINTVTGATILAQWIGGELTVPPVSDMVLQPKGILVTVGTAEEIEALAKLCGGARPLPDSGPFLIGGRGNVANKVAELLQAVGEEVYHLRDEEIEDSQVLETHTLERLSVGNAQAVILALESDRVTLFDTIVLKDFAPHVPVIARVNKSENLAPLYRAGVDFALSISDVAGHIVARKLLGEESFAIGPKLKLRRTHPGKLTGHHPASLAIRDRTGCSVVAVERDNEEITSFDHNFRFQENDRVYVCGDREGLHRFEDLYGQNRR